MTVSKQHIIDEIRRTAEANGGTPLGTSRFAAETGIEKSDWLGKIWARWGDALEEAGYPPNELKSARSEVDVLTALASLTGELGRYPTANEIKLKARQSEGFPWHSTVRKLGKKADLVVKLLEYAEKHGLDDVVHACKEALPPGGETIPEQVDRDADEQTFGFVYLMKSGKHYKVGRSVSTGQRERQLSIQLPEPITTVHDRSRNQDGRSGWDRGVLASTIRGRTAER